MRDKYTIEIPDNLMNILMPLITAGKLTEKILCEIIDNTIDKNPYTWYKTKELINRDTPVFYTREPNCFQADDFVISKAEKENEYIATQYKNSIEEKLLGKDIDLKKLKKRVENFVVLLTLREEIRKIE